MTSPQTTDWQPIALEVRGHDGRVWRLGLEGSSPDETSFSFGVRRQFQDMIAGGPISGEPFHDVAIMTDQRWSVELKAGGFGALSIVRSDP
jgi:hypothetical protein